MPVPLAETHPICHPFSVRIAPLSTPLKPCLLPDGSVMTP